VVETIYSNGAYRLANSNGDALKMPINDKFLKKNTIHYHINTISLIKQVLFMITLTLNF